MHTPSPSTNTAPAPAPAVRYRFDELEKDVPMALLERRRVMGEQAMISHVTLFKGCVVPVHQHPNEQFCAILRGKLRFTFGPGGPEPVDVGPGEVLHLPSNCPHGAEAIEETVVLDIFSPPCAMTGIDRR